MHNKQQIWQRKWQINGMIAAGAIALINLGINTEQTLAQEEVPLSNSAGVNTAAPIPSGGVPLFGDNTLSRLKLTGSAAAQASVTEVPVEGQTFTKALRIQTKAKTISDTSIQLSANTINSFKSGDTLLLRLYLRTVQMQKPNTKGRIRLSMDQAIWEQTITAGKEWTYWVLPVPARKGYASGAVKLSIGISSTERQIIEIGGLEVFNYSDRFQPYQLPYIAKTYEGREANAAWRQAAYKRIEQHRKGNLTVVVTNSSGTPIPGANIHVRMQRHAYSFGSAIAENFFVPSSGNTDRVKYQDNIKPLFNEAVIENGLKWSRWEIPAKRQQTIQAVQWLRDNGLKVRGHTLVWPSWSNSPANVKQLYDDTLEEQGEDAAKAVLRDRIINHVREQASFFKGQLTDWDVVNETIGHNDFQRILGKSVLIDWFKAAHEADPNAILYINEHSVENGSQADAFYNEVKYLLDNGAPLGGIGLQGHIDAISIPKFISILDRFAKFQLPIKITEFDSLSPDEQLQADITRDFMTAVFSHPATVGFLMWGFWDGRHWLYDAPIYYNNWTLKPSGKAYIDLVFKQWWTDVQGQADANGEYKTRGFLGDYEVTASTNSTSKTVSTTLLRSGTNLQIVLH